MQIIFGVFDTLDPMRQVTHTLSRETSGPGLYDITSEVVGWCSQKGIAQGLLTLFIRYTSASLTIQENADPDVRRDLQDYFARIAPEHGPYRHTMEGPDDMPAHIRSALTQVQLTIPVEGGRPVLGTWQGIYLFEHRRQAHHRQVSLHLLGE
jgi:secondary thiamine-phosphate synthase enzyme